MSKGHHVSEQDLASLAEGRLDAEREAGIRAHVARCPQCLAGYAEAVAYRSRLLDQPEAFAASEVAVAPATGLDGGRSRVGGDSTRSNVGRRGRAARAGRNPIQRRTRLRTVTAGLGLAAVGAAVLVFSLLPFRTGPLKALDDTEWAALRSAAAGLSAGEMILPGVEDDMDWGVGSSREGGLVDPRSLQSVAKSLAPAPGGTPATPEAAYWLGVAHLASGKAVEARRVVQASLGDFPTDLNLLLLDAVVAYHESDLSGVEAKLRRILELDPDNVPAGFNLGYLLSETGRPAEAGRYLRNVQESAPESGPAQRAESILLRLP